MEDFPDEMLVHVLSFAETEMLLGELRAVCWRWRNLALHPKAWEDRIVLCDMYDFLLKRVFALAPCLNKLAIVPLFVTNEPTGLKELAKLAAATPCKLRCLTLEGTRSSDLDLMSCVVRRQVERGRLRQLSVRVLHGGGSQLREMLEAVADLDLEQLSLDTGHKLATQDAIPTTSAGRWGKGCLKNLKLSIIKSDPLFEFVVTHRAESLESVDFEGSADDGVLTAPWVAALGACRKLRYACVPAVPEVASLAACRSLAHLVITSYFSDAVTEAVAMALTAALCSPLARAKQLRILEFKTWDCDYQFMTGVNIVYSLAQSGASCLEELSLPPIQEASELKDLLLALSGLPRLHTLRLHSLPPADFLRGLTPCAAPGLTLLELNDDSDCADLGFLVTVSNVVQRNPRLHVVTLCCGGLCPYNWLVGAFGHNPREDCGVSHDSSVDWQCVSV